MMTTGRAFLGEVKKQASGFLLDKLKQARLAFGDVTPAELLVEEATNNEPCVPDAKTMASIADATFDMDDYWRIANVLHQRLRCVDWKEWRPVYKALVVLEFLLTHGQEDLSREFFADVGVMQDLRSFNYIDDKGFNWGACMQKRTDSILTLLTDEERLKEARRRAIKISQEIQGFGNQVQMMTMSLSSSNSPSSNSPSRSSASSSRNSRTSSFGSHFSDYSATVVYASAPSSDVDCRYEKKFDDDWKNKWPATVDEEDDTNTNIDTIIDHDHSWDAPVVEESLLSRSSSYNYEGWSAKLCSRMFGDSNSSSSVTGFRSLSQAERRANCKKNIERQHSLGY